MAIGKTLQINEQALPDDINKMAGWGLFAARPATGDVLAGSFYMSTDTNVLYQEQNGSWVAILEVEGIVAGAETYAPGYHAGNVGGLSAIDTDLAVGNIKKDVVIFGFTGTLVGNMVELFHELDFVLDSNTWTTVQLTECPASAVEIIVLISYRTLSGLPTDRGIKVYYDGVEKLAFTTLNTLFRIMFDGNFSANDIEITGIWGPEATTAYVDRTCIYVI